MVDKNTFLDRLYLIAVASIISVIILGSAIVFPNPFPDSIPRGWRAFIRYNCFSVILSSFVCFHLFKGITQIKKILLGILLFFSIQFAVIFFAFAYLYFGKIEPSVQEMAFIYVPGIQIIGVGVFYSFEKLAVKLKLAKKADIDKGINRSLRRWWSMIRKRRSK